MIQEIPLEQIFDNPYNPRSRYDTEKTKELASSIEQNGLIHAPKARQFAVETYQLAEGGYRLRAFKLLAKKEPEKWGKMPLDLMEISDTTMAIFALEENLKRQNLTPMDTANAIAKYFEVFPATREEDLAVKLSMSQGSISNMRRVVKLPKKVLKYVDDETISYTQARELCSLMDITGITKGAVESDQVMISAIQLIGTKDIPATVVGMRKAIREAVKAVVVDGRFRELSKNVPTANPPVFDTDAMKCFKCPKYLKTSDGGTENSYACLDIQCWDLAQTNAKRKAAEEIEEARVKTLAEEEERAKAKAEAEEAAAAKTKLEEEMKASTPVPPPVENIPQEIKTEEVKKKPEPLIFHVDAHRLGMEGDIYKSFSALEPINGEEVKKPFLEADENYLSVGDYDDIAGAKRAYRLVPREQYTGVIRSLKAPDGVELSEFYANLKLDPLGPYNGVIAKREDKEYVMVGPEVVFAPADNPEPVTSSSALDKSAEIPVGKDEQEPEEEEEEEEEEKEETEEPENAEENKVAPETTKPTPPAEELATTPAPASPAAEGTDELFTVCLTLSILVPKASTMSEPERKIEAWKKFKQSVINEDFHASDLTITHQEIITSSN